MTIHPIRMTGLVIGALKPSPILIKCKNEGSIWVRNSSITEEQFKIDVKYSEWQMI